MKLDDFSVVSSSPEPMYEQVKGILLRYIDSLPPDVTYLPYENEIEKRLGVGKVTVRRALRGLRAEGIIETARKRGSRILRRGCSASVGAAAERAVTNRTLGAVITSDDPDPFLRTSHEHWSIEESFERLAGTAGATVLVRNVSSTEWGDPEKVVDSLAEAGVAWAFVTIHSTVDVEKLVKAARRKGIKLAVFADFYSSFDYVHLPAGVDFVLSNQHRVIYETLHSRFADRDFVGYVASLADSSWAKPRHDTIKLFCDEAAIPFEAVFVEGEIDQDDSRTNAGRRGMARLAPKLKGRKRPLVFAANDAVAAGVLTETSRLDITVPEQLAVLGFDNRPASRGLNFSTFDRNCAGVGAALFAMCVEYFSGTSETTTSRGRMVYPFYIQRKSTAATSEPR